MIDNTYMDSDDIIKEKATPMKALDKPTLESFSKETTAKIEWNPWTKKCPRCNYIVAIHHSRSQLRDNKTCSRTTNYCSNCGQRIIYEEFNYIDIPSIRKC